MTAPIVFEDVELDAEYSTRLTLEVAPRRATAIIGDGASGVDQLAPIVLGLEPPRRGRVLVFGEDLAALPRAAALAFRRTLGYVPARDGLLQNLTLQQNVALPLRFGGSWSEREIATRLRMVLRMVRLGGAEGLRPAEATEEQRSRASLARALASDPELVIMDHPFDGLSGRAAAELLELARGGETGDGARRTVFLTSQDLPDRLRPRIEARHRIRKGQLERDG